MPSQRLTTTALVFVLAVGCSSSKPQKKPTPQPKPAPQEKPAAPKEDPKPDYDLSGQWTRDDGLTFEVKDDGRKVEGTLVPFEDSPYERYTFTLDWKGPKLVGSASFAPKFDPTMVQTTTWKLEAGSETAVDGQVEVLDVDPDDPEGEPQRVWVDRSFTVTGGVIASATGAPDETKPDETTPDETTPDETTPDETTPDETTPDETTPDETKPDEMKPDETTPDETKPDEMKPDETTPDETKPDETKPDETKPDEMKPDETKPDETKPDETKPDETKPDETKPDEAKPDETKPDEAKPDESKPDTAVVVAPVPGDGEGESKAEEPAKPEEPETPKIDPLETRIGVVTSRDGETLRGVVYLFANHVAVQGDKGLTWLRRSEVASVGSEAATEGELAMMVTARRPKTEPDINADPLDPQRKALAARIEAGYKDIEVGLDTGDAQGAEGFLASQDKLLTEYAALVTPRGGQAELDGFRQRHEALATRARELKAEAEKRAAEEKAEAERLAAEQKAAEEKAEAERLAAEQKAAEEKAEAERLAAEQKAAEEKAEAERMAAEQKAAEEKAEAERLAAEQKAAEEKAEAERLAAEKRAAEEKKAAESAKTAQGVKIAEMLARGTTDTEQFLDWTFAALQAGNLEMLKSLSMSRKHCDALYGAAGESVHAGLLARLESDLAKLRKAHPDLDKATLVKKQTSKVRTVPKGYDLKASSKGADFEATTAVESEAVFLVLLTYQAGDQTKRLGLGRFMKASDGTWRFVHLARLPKKK